MMKYSRFDSGFVFGHDRNVKHLGTHSLASHYHNLFEVYYITDGTCTYFVDGKTYLLKGGDIILVPEGVIHNTEYVNSVHSRMLINCSESFVPHALRQRLTTMTPLFRNKYPAEEIKYIFRKIEREYHGERDLQKLACYTHLLFYTICENENKYIPTKSGIEYMEKALDYLSRNFASGITLGEISRECSVSPEHFSRTFKKETGFTFCEYVNLLRLKKAEAMLKEHPAMSIAEVSSKCGFNDSNYFSTKFKKMYGVSPKKLQMDSQD